MKNLENIKTRFLKDPINIRIGNLASDLARLSSFLENPRNARSINDIIEESKFFIEWITPEAPLEVQSLLAEIQRKLALWQHHPIKDQSEAKKLRDATSTWSMHLLKSSGLL